MNYAELIAKIKLRLKYLGIPIDGDEDDDILTYLIDRQADYIKNYCNIAEVPTALYGVLVDRVCGDFLFEKSSYDVESLGINLDKALKQISIGDTSTTSAVGSGDLSPQQKFDNLVGYLSHCGEGNELEAFRCVKWN